MRTAPTAPRNGCTKSRWKLNRNSLEGTRRTHSLPRWSPKASGDRIYFVLAVCRGGAVLEAVVLIYRGRP